MINELTKDTATLFLSRNQVRARYGIGHTTLYDWVERYGFPAGYRMGPRLTRWKISELEAWEAKQKEGVA